MTTTVEDATTIGSSEIAAAVGIDPWMSRFQLWERKTGKRADEPDTHHTKRGKYLEPGLIDWLTYIVAEEHPDVRVVPASRATLQGRERIVRARPDVLVLDAHSDAVLGVGEIKAPHRTWIDWFDEDRRVVVPPNYFAQVAWQAIAASAKHDVDRLLVGAYLDGDMHYRMIPRDEAYEEDLLDAAYAFVRCVETDTPPPADGSVACIQFLRRRHPKHLKGMLQADEVAQDTWAEIGSAIVRYGEARLAMKRAKAQIVEQQSVLMQRLGDAEGAAIEWAGKVYWRKNADSTVIDQDALIADLVKHVSPDVGAELLKKHTRSEPGSRVMRVYPIKGE